jgi:hypothetical protein
MKTRFALGVILAITLGTCTMINPSYASDDGGRNGGRGLTIDIAPNIRAPVVVSGDNVYVTWFTNESTVNSNFEVIFRASTDGGTTFGIKTNLSNTNNTDSVDAEIAAEGGNVMVTWWERNSTSNEPVAKVSTDNGATFGPVLRLATNGTIGEEAEEEGE